MCMNYFDHEPKIKDYVGPSLEQTWQDVKISNHVTDQIPSHIAPSTIILGVHKNATQFDQLGSDPN